MRFILGNVLNRLTSLKARPYGPKLHVVYWAVTRTGEFGPAETDVLDDSGAKLKRDLFNKQL